MCRGIASKNREEAMAQDWPMFIMQSIVIFGLVGALFIRA
jgi:hypothetical protein